MRAHFKISLGKIYAPKKNGHCKKDKGKDYQTKVFTFCGNKVPYHGKQNGQSCDDVA